MVWGEREREGGVEMGRGRERERERKGHLQVADVERVAALPAERALDPHSAGSADAWDLELLGVPYPCPADVCGTLGPGVQEKEMAGGGRRFVCRSCEFTLAPCLGCARKHSHIHRPQLGGTEAGEARRVLGGTDHASSPLASAV